MVIEVFNTDITRTHRSYLISKAVLFQIIYVSMSFIAAFLVVYRSVDFWDRTESLVEQPSVRFKNQMMLNVDTSGGEVLLWSTFPAYNSLRQSNLVIPSVTVRETDTNSDGKNDAFYLTISLTLPDTTHVTGVRLALVFDYMLAKPSLFQMEALAFLSHSSGVHGASFNILGDLELRTKQPLTTTRGLDTSYNISHFNASSGSLDLASVFDKYTRQGVTTVLTNTYPSWQGGRGSGQPFVITAQINYAKTRVNYTPTFWNSVKWAWIQYASILFILLIVMDRVRFFVFGQQIVSTIVQRCEGSCCCLKED